MIKKAIAILMVTLVLSGCHKATRDYGGSMTLELPKGQKLEEITWKDDSALWYLTRPMRDDEQPETHTFKADTERGVFEGTVTIIESK